MCIKPINDLASGEIDLNGNRDESAVKGFQIVRGPANIRDKGKQCDDNDATMPRLLDIVGENCLRNVTNDRERGKGRGFKIMRDITRNERRGIRGERHKGTPEGNITIKDIFNKSRAGGWMLIKIRNDALTVDGHRRSRGTR